MGLFGGGNSKRTTTNQDNRVINDFGGAHWESNSESYADSSQDVDSSITGEFAGNSGSITVLDGGSIDLTAENLNSMSALSSESFGLTDSLSNTMAGLSSESFSLADNLSNTMVEASNSMLSESLASSGQVFNTAALSLDSANARTIDAAMAFTEASAFQSENNNDFALALSAQNGEAALMAQNDNNNALENGFKSSMQFVEQFSRSDGASISESTNKMVMVLAGAGLIGYFLVKKLG
jgi:hypothetical protein